ncbi:MAG: filamentous hemagglutinin N-terminal domain-containing protein [Bacillota bacterium]
MKLSRKIRRQMLRVLPQWMKCFARSVTRAGAKVAEVAREKCQNFARSINSGLRTLNSGLKAHTKEWAAAALAAGLIVAPYSVDIAAGGWQLAAVNAAPEGGVVVGGQATIAQSGAVTNIVQSTQRAAIDWTSFDIAKHEAVNFQQPNSSAVALNRILGNNPTAIYGQLNANGQVYLSNPNGMLFAPGAQINVAGLIATTSHVDPLAFMQTGMINTSERNGTINMQGSIFASGGLVEIKGATAINVGGLIKATTIDGSGGVISVIADQVNGSLDISKATLIARGGLIETSAAKITGLDSAVVNAGAVSGTGGTWLIDPADFNIGGTSSDMSGTVLGDNLNSQNMVILSQSGTHVTAGAGNVNVYDVVSWTTNNSLTLSAYNDVNIFNNIINTAGAGSITLKADNTGTGSGAINFTGAGVYLNTAATGGNVKIYYNPVNYMETGQTNYAPFISAAPGHGTVYMLVNSLGLSGDNAAVKSLAAISNTSVLWNQNFALGKDINAAATSGWNINAGVTAGFSPMGNAAIPFTGKFTGGSNLTGGNNTLSNLFINSTAKYVGLFGYISGSDATISNLNLTNVIISGSNDLEVSIGAIAGHNNYTSVISGISVNGATLNGSSTSGGTVYIGGVAGENKSGTISNVTVSGSEVNGSSTGTGYVFAGGVAGANRNSAGINIAVVDATTIRSSSNNSYGVYAGGIAGWSQGTMTGVTIGNSVVNGGNDQSGISNIGGVAGYNASTISGAAVNCVTVGGSVNAGERNAGGVVGYNYMGNVSSVTVSGGVINVGSSSGQVAVGGIAGRNGTSSYGTTYSSGTISDANLSNVNISGSTSASTAYIGGLVGINGAGPAEGVLGNCTISGSSTSGVVYAGDVRADNLALNNYYVTLTAGNINLSGATVSLVGTNAAIRAANFVTLGATTIGDSLSVNANGEVTQTGGAITAGTAMINAGSNAITLTNAANDFGAVAVTGTSASIRDGNDLTINNSTLSGSFLAQAANSLFVDGDILDNPGVGVTATATLLAGRNVVLYSDSDIISSAGQLNIALNSDSDADKSGAIILLGSGAHLNRLTSNGGNIELKGCGANGDAQYAWGNADYYLYPNYISDGIYTGNAVISAGAGNVKIFGHGSNTIGGAGVDLRGATIAVGSGGTIEINGVGSSSASENNQGIELSGATLQTASGEIALTGVAGNGVNVNGIQMLGTTSIISSSGAIQLSGLQGADSSSLGICVGGDSQPVIVGDGGNPLALYTGDITIAADKQFFEENCGTSVKSIGKLTIKPYTSGANVTVSKEVVGFIDTSYFSGNPAVYRPGFSEISIGDTTNTNNLTVNYNIPAGSSRLSLAASNNITVSASDNFSQLQNVVQMTAGNELNLYYTTMNNTSLTANNVDASVNGNYFGTLAISAQTATIKDINDIILGASTVGSLTLTAIGGSVTVDGASTLAGTNNTIRANNGNLSFTTSGKITVNSGGNLYLAATSGNIINNSTFGADAITLNSGGRYVLWSNKSADTTLGGLSVGTYGTTGTYSSNPPSGTPWTVSPTNSGNWIMFATAGGINITGSLLGFFAGSSYTVNLLSGGTSLGQASVTGNNVYTITYSGTLSSPFMVYVYNLDYGGNAVASYLTGSSYDINRNYLYTDTPSLSTLRTIVGSYSGGHMPYSVTGSNISLVSGVALNVSGDFTIDGNIYTNANNQTYSGAVTAISTATLAATSSGAIHFINNLTATAAPLNIITTGGAINVDGIVNTTGQLLTFNAGSGHITATNSGNDFSILSLSGGQAAITDINGLTLATSTLTDVTDYFGLTLTANGGITQSGALAISGKTTLMDSGNIISLNNVNNNFNHLNLTAASAVIRDANALNLAGTDVGSAGSLQITTGGDLTQGTSSGEKIIGGAVALIATGSINLQSSFNDFNGILGLTAAAARVRQQDNKNLTLGSATITGSGDANGLAIYATIKTISQAPGTNLNVTNWAGFNNPAGTISLLNTGNNFGGTLSVSGYPSDQGPLKAEILAAGPVTLGSCDILGSFSLTAGGNVNQAASSSLHGGITVSAPGFTVDLSRANYIENTVSITGASANIDAGSYGVVIGNMLLGSGNLTLQNYGQISQTGMITAGAVTVGNSGSGYGINLSGANVINGSVSASFSGSGNHAFSLSNSSTTSGQVAVAATSGTLSSVAITYSNAGLNIAEISGSSIASTLNIRAGGAITQTAAITAGSTTINAGSNAITFANTGNDFAILALTGDQTAVSDKNNLTFGLSSLSNLTASAANFTISDYLAATSGITLNAFGSGNTAGYVTFANGKTIAIVSGYATLSSRPLASVATSLITGASRIVGNYTVDDYIDLNNVRNDLSTYAAYQMNQDIDANSSAGFLTIGDDNHKFYGRFDGQNNTISNLLIDQTAQYVGLFGYVGSAATISSLNLSNATITGYKAGGVGYVGGIAGNNMGKLNALSVSGGNISGSGSAGTIYVGGVAGQNYSGTISGATVGALTLSGSGIADNAYLGGVVGYNSAGVTPGTGIVTGFTVSDATLAVNSGTFGTAYVGGVVGFHLSGTISSGSTNSVLLNGSNLLSGNAYVGGIAGCNYSTIRNVSLSNARLSGSSSTGDVFVGGVAGYNYSVQISDVEVDSTTLSGSNVSWGKVYVGGAAGDNIGQISAVRLSADTINGSSTHSRIYVGGVVGRNMNIVGVAASISNVTLNSVSLNGTTVSKDANVSSGMVSVGSVAGENNSSVINGATLSGMTVTGRSTNGTINSGGVAGDNTGTIQSVTLVSSTISADNLSTGAVNVGGVAGASHGTLSGATINGVTVVGNSTSGAVFVGGAMGYNRGLIDSVSISNGMISGSNVSVSAVSVGGVVGYGDYSTISNTTLTNETITGNSTSGYTYVGGAAGQNRTGTITGVILNDCTISGYNISSGAVYVGGVAGFVSGAGASLGNVSLNNATISGDCVSRGYVSIGGIVAVNYSTIGSVTVNNSALNASNSDGDVALGGVAGVNYGTINGAVVLNDDTLSGSSTSGAVYTGDVRGDGQELNNYYVTLTAGNINMSGATVSLNGTNAAIRAANSVTLRAITANQLSVSTIDGDILQAAGTAAAVKIAVSGVATFNVGGSEHNLNVGWYQGSIDAPTDANDFGIIQDTLTFTGIGVHNVTYSNIAVGRVAPNIDYTSGGGTKGTELLIPFIETDYYIHGNAHQSLAEDFNTGAAAINKNVRQDQQGFKFHNLTINAGNGWIYLDTYANNEVSGVFSMTAAGADFSAGGSLVLGGTTIGDSLSVTATGAVTQSGAITVGGAAVINAGNNAITLNNAANNFGTVSVTGGASSLVDVDSIEFGNSTISAGGITVIAGGSIGQNEGTTLTVNGDVVLRTDSGGAGTGTVASGITINLVDPASTAKIYYNPTDYLNPTDFVNITGGNKTGYMLINELGLSGDAATAKSLAAVSNSSGLWNNNYAFGKDIDATATSGWNIDISSGTPVAAGFKPIGNGTAHFTGKFDGFGNTLSNLYINSIRIWPPVWPEAMQYVGMFGYIGANGAIGNLEVRGVRVSSSNIGYVGGLAGYNEGAIRNVTLSNGMLSGTTVNGGIAGYNSGVISEATISGGTIGGNRNGVTVGGVAGDNYGTISNSIVEGVTINSVNTSGPGEVYAGGVVGHNYQGTINGVTVNSTLVSGRSSATAIDGQSATAATINVGGVAGYNQGEITGVTFSSVTISGSNTATGTLYYPGSHVTTGTINAGGVAGQSTGEINGVISVNTMVSGSNATTGTDGSSGSLNAGGVAGQNSGIIGSITLSGGTISNSGSMTGSRISLGTASVGGAAGKNTSGTISGVVISGVAINGAGVNSNNYDAHGSVYAGGVAGSNGTASGGGASISNVTISGGTILGTGGIHDIYVGGVAGYNYGATSNIEITGATIGGNSLNGSICAGGMAGKNIGSINTAMITGGTISSNGNAGSYADTGGAAGYNNGLISGIEITGVTISGAAWSSYVDVGGAIGEGGGTLSGVVISGVTLSGNSSSGAVYVGGGMGSDGSSASGVIVSGVTITGNSSSSDVYVGGGMGLKGFGTNGVVTVTNATIRGNSTSGTVYAGGMAGKNNGGTLSGFEINGGTVSGNSVSGQYADVGGIAGYNSGTISNDTISNITISGSNISGYYVDVGGVTGWNEGGTATISGVTLNSVAMSASSRSSDIFAGGIAGYHGYPNYAGALIDNVTINGATISVNSTAGEVNIGGIVARSTNGAIEGGVINDVTINGSSSSGEVKIGGVVGWAYQGTIVAVTLSGTTLNGGSGAGLVRVGDVQGDAQGLNNVYTVLIAGSIGLSDNTVSLSGTNATINAAGSVVLGAVKTNTLSVSTTDGDILQSPQAAADSKIVVTGTATFSVGGSARNLNVGWYSGLETDPTDANNFGINENSITFTGTGAHNVTYSNIAVGRVVPDIDYTSGGGTKGNELLIPVVGREYFIHGNEHQSLAEDFNTGADAINKNVRQDQQGFKFHNLTINAGTGWIYLNTYANNEVAGALSMTAAGADITVGGALAFAASRISNDMNIVANGAVTQNTAITAGAMIVNAGHNAITLANAGNDFDALRLTGGAAAVVDKDDLTFGAVNLASLNVTTTDGDILQAEGTAAVVKMIISGVATFNVGGSGHSLNVGWYKGHIDSPTDANDFGISKNRINFSGAGVHDVTYSNIAQGRVAPNISYGPGTRGTETLIPLTFVDYYIHGNAHQSLAEDFNTGAAAINKNVRQDQQGFKFHNLTINAGNGWIYLDTYANNEVSGVFSMTAAGADFSAGGSLVLGGTTIGDSLSVTATGAVTQSGAITVGGAAVINAGNNAITLNNAANNFGTVSVTGGASSLVDVDSIEFGNSTISAGGITVIAGGSIGQNEGTTLTVNGDVVLRTDSGGAGTGTVASGITINLVDPASTAKIYYNPTDYLNPTDFVNITGGNKTGYMLINELGLSGDAATAKSLAAVSNSSGLWNNNYAFGKDIDATATSGWNIDISSGTPVAAGFKPIGNGTAHFTGKFDGFGNTLSNLYINSIRIWPPVWPEAMQYVGMFGYIGANGAIGNLEVRGVRVSSSNIGYVGGLAGYNEGAIRNVTLSNGMLSGTTVNGGIAGYNSGVISEATISGGTIGGNRNGVTVGGVAGDNYGTISNSIVEGVTINSVNTSGPGEVYAGGVVGHNYQGTINGVTVNSTLVSGRSSATAIDGQSATAATINVGGVAGYNQGEITGVTFSSVTISGSNTATGTLYYPGSHVTTGTINAGGVAGQSTGEINGVISVNTMVSGSNATTGTDGSSGSLNAGGVAGQNSGIIGSITLSGGTISNSGSMTGSRISLGTASVGGAAGKNTSGTISGVVISGVAINGAGVNSNNYDAHGSVYAGGVAGSNGTASGGGASISNVTISGGTILGTGGIHDIYVGGVAGYNYGATSNIEITGATIGGNSLNGSICAGGMAGKNIGSINTAMITGGTISSNGNAGSYADTGGAAGYNNGLISGIEITGVTISGAAWSSYVDVGGAIGEGGGTLSGVVISGVTLSGNSSSGAVYVGGGMGSDGSSASGVIVSGVTITGNSSSSDVYVGGGMGLKGFGTNGVVTVTNATIRGNSTSGTVYAGGMAGKNNGGTLSGFEINGGTVSGNSVSGQYADVGGIAGYNSGTISNDTISNITISGSNISGYYVDVGGVTGWNEGGTATISGVTLNSVAMSASSRSSDIFAGGIAGYHGYPNYAGALIDNVTINGATISVNSTAGEVNIGGIVARSTNGAIEGGVINDVTINGSSSSGEVKIGGVVGWAYQGTIVAVTLSGTTLNGGSGAGLVRVGDVQGDAQGLNNVYTVLIAGSIGLSDNTVSLSGTNATINAAGSVVLGAVTTNTLSVSATDGDILQSPQAAANSKIVVSGTATFNVGGAARSFNLGWYTGNVLQPAAANDFGINASRITFTGAGVHNLTYSNIAVGRVAPVISYSSGGGTKGVETIIPPFSNGVLQEIEAARQAAINGAAAVAGAANGEANQKQAQNARAGVVVANGLPKGNIDPGLAGLVDFVDGAGANPNLNPKPEHDSEEDLPVK